MPSRRKRTRAETQDKLPERPLRRREPKTTNFANSPLECEHWPSGRRRRSSRIVNREGPDKLLRSLGKSAVETQQRPARLPQRNANVGDDDVAGPGMPPPLSVAPLDATGEEEKGVRVADPTPPPIPLSRDAEVEGPPQKEPRYPKHTFLSDMRDGSIMTVANAAAILVANSLFQPEASTTTPPPPRALQVHDSDDATAST